MRAGLLGILLVPSLLPAPGFAAQTNPLKGIVCSGPTPFHCAVFGAGFNQFHESFKGRVRPDWDVAAEFCASRNSMRVLTAKRRPWPGGSGNEVFVVDVTCGPRAVVERPAQPRPETLARREQPDFAPRVAIEPERDAQRPARRRWSPPAANAALEDTRPPARRRPARDAAENASDQANRDPRSAPAVERERPAQRPSAPPAPTERPAERPTALETPKTPEPAKTPEIVRETVKEPVDATPAAAPKPANEATSPDGAKPAGDAGSSARRKRYEESAHLRAFLTARRAALFRSDRLQRRALRLAGGAELREILAGMMRRARQRARRRPAGSPWHRRSSRRT